jgi:Ca2+-binding RTX toxin-like protein
MRLYVALVAAAVVTVLPVNAFAATASTSNGELHYNAAPGEANDVDISESPPDSGDESSPGAYTITDQGAVIVAGAGCVQLGDHQVSCSPGVNVFMFLGDQVDTAELTQGGGGELGVRGGAGADRLTLCIDCVAGLEGNAGDDVLQAGDAGSFALVGGWGDDAITGGRGDDFIQGDRFAGVAGNDTIASGDGFDEITPGGGDDYVDAGGGVDFVELLGAPRSVVVDLRAGTLTGYGRKTLIGVEGLGGTPHPDRLYGDRHANLLFGGSLRLVGGGGDLLVGRGGRDDLIDNGGESIRDRLFGGSGRDRLYGGRGPDLLRGGPGDDLEYGGRSDGGDDDLWGGFGNDEEFGGAGDDRLHAADGQADKVNCGPGFDHAWVDRRDHVSASCEVVRFG